MSSGNPQYLLWRRECRGRQHLVNRYHSRRQAERACRQLEKGARCKTYWVTVLHPRSTSI